MVCPYGGNPGTWMTLAPSISPPKIGYRVIPGSVWWTLIFWPWRQYLAMFAHGLHAIPPSLAPLGASGVHFTDIESLRGLVNPSEFAFRLGLPPQARRECDQFGCAVVEFDIIPAMNPTVPLPANLSVNQGLTVGGAREWLTQGNIELVQSMRVKYIDVTPNGPRGFDLPL